MVKFLPLPQNGPVEILFIIRGSIVVSISACHAEDPGSIPGCGVSEQIIECKLAICTCLLIIV